MNNKNDTKKRIALSKKNTLFGLSRENLKLVTGGGGIIIQSPRGEFSENGIGTSPSTPSVNEG